MIPTGSKAVIN